MQQILKSTETTGGEFSTPGGTCLILLEGHAGGTWQMEAKRKDGTVWVEDEMKFTGSGLKVWWSAHELRYRLTGGSAGAESFLVSIRDVGNRQ